MQTRTRRQKEVLDFISRYIDSHGYEPSYQVIARHIGVSSKAGIAKHIKALEAQGCLIRRIEGRGFSIASTNEANGSDSVIKVRWLDVPDGSDLPEDWPRSAFTVPRFLLGFNFEGNVFAYRVPDDSMAGRNFCEDDIALIEERSFVRDGDVIIAIIKKKNAVMRIYYRDGSKVELRTAAEPPQVLKFPSEVIEIRGVFRAMLRPVS
ncbi:MAG TPA: S24 family peptidase [Pyrinomonadaceae bacterium]|nr:S24 family peptidase [Pyrinomonadaceae bacterium]